jgi:hypothetical protein
MRAPQRVGNRPRLQTQPRGVHRGHQGRDCQQKQVGAQRAPQPLRYRVGDAAPVVAGADPRGDARLHAGGHHRARQLDEPDGERVDADRGEVRRAQRARPVRVREVKRAAQQADGHHRRAHARRRDGGGHAEQRRERALGRRVRLAREHGGVARVAGRVAGRIAGRVAVGDHGHVRDRPRARGRARGGGRVASPSRVSRHPLLVAPRGPRDAHRAAVCAAHRRGHRAAVTRRVPLGRASSDDVPDWDGRARRQHARARVMALAAVRPTCRLAFDPERAPRAKQIQLRPGRSPVF